MTCEVGIFQIPLRDQPAFPSTPTPVPSVSSLPVRTDEFIVTTTQPIPVVIKPTIKPIVESACLIETSTNSPACDQFSDLTITLRQSSFRKDMFDKDFAQVALTVNDQKIRLTDRDADQKVSTVVTTAHHSYHFQGLRHETKNNQIYLVFSLATCPISQVAYAGEPIIIAIPGQKISSETVSDGLDIKARSSSTELLLSKETTKTNYWVLLGSKIGFQTLTVIVDGKTVVKNLIIK